eukprot:CAMPEP_0167750574 /NCGR_PEP_ID=MMETSP0110_2-20121227/6071_1 /TAXON_ID=629695 /ORGANISM="Gymnochlora sp., Strain CCMP2014" /LENGTH=410 /DNA_ID=CAMNT_0007635919 /DNA_START=34 /DNA_END=1267 /DNA_ORIENTATION=+
MAAALAVRPFNARMSARRSLSIRPRVALGEMRVVQGCISFAKEAKEVTRDTVVATREYIGAKSAGLVTLVGAGGDFAMDLGATVYESGPSLFVRNLVASHPKTSAATATFALLFLMAKKLRSPPPPPPQAAPQVAPSPPTLDKPRSIPKPPGAQSQNARTLSNQQAFEALTAAAPVTSTPVVKSFEAVPPVKFVFNGRGILAREDQTIDLDYSEDKKKADLLISGTPGSFITFNGLAARSIDSKAPYVFPIEVTPGTTREYVLTYTPPGSAPLVDIKLNIKRLYASNKLSNIVVEYEDVTEPEKLEENIDGRKDADQQVEIADDGEPQKEDVNEDTETIIEPRIKQFRLRPPFKTDEIGGTFFAFVPEEVDSVKLSITPERPGTEEHWEIRSYRQDLYYGFGKKKQKVSK